MGEVKDHFLEQPGFGIPPEKVRPKEPKKYEFEDILEMVRQRPGEWAKIAVYKGSNRKLTLAQARASRARLWRYLVSQCPLEEWNLSVRPTPDTWCDRELWVRFVGQMTPEEALKMEDLRKDAFSKDRHTTLDPKTAKQARQHAREILQARENRRYGGSLG